MHHTGWLGGQAGNICQLVALSKGDEKELLQIAEDVGVNITDLIRAAVQNRLTAWDQSQDKIAAAKSDILLGKLAQR
jgi:hypothetical protein